MAATHRAIQTGITFAATKHMLSVFNGSGSGVILRAYRIWVLNNQTTAITGVYTTIEVRRSTAQSGGTSVTPVKMDTSSSSLPAQVLAAHGATVTAASADTFVRVGWSNDEPAAGTGTIDELEAVPALMEILGAGLGSSDLEPVVLREGYGITVYHAGSTAVGNMDAIIEFTSV
jgi:hypothetical protein